MFKKILTSMAMLFIVCTFVLTGCGKSGLKDNPATDANVISNGGMTVVKGDYLYYVNGYIDETTLTTKDNKFGEVKHSAIYRTKLDQGEISKDKDGFLNCTELVVPKVVGFANGGFYIIDDFIYYATPYMNLSSDGVLQSNRVEFHKINIDGTKDETLYVTNANEDKLDWKIYKVDGTVYILTFCESKIISYNTATKKVVAEIENSKSYAFLDEENYSTNKSRTSDLYKYVYYTRDKVADDKVAGNLSGNVVCRFNVTNGEVEKINTVDNYTYAIIHVDAESVYYTKADATISGAAMLYNKNVDTSWRNATEMTISDGAYTSYYICDFGDNLMINTDANGTWIVEGGKSKIISSTAYTILAVYNNYAYYVTDNVLYRFDVRGEVVDNQITVETVTDSNKTNQIINENYIDFDNQRVYVYSSYTSESESSNYYLNYIDDTSLEQRFVGKFLDDHLPVVPEQDEKYGEDPDIEYIPHID